jgi:hypothetical protein
MLPVAAACCSCCLFLLLLQQLLLCCYGCFQPLHLFQQRGPAATQAAAAADQLEIAAEFA